MSRSGYSEDVEDHWRTIIWRGAVASALRGKRGQAFLREMLAVLDALPEKKLISHDLVRHGDVCALGAVGKARGLDMSLIDPEDSDTVAGKFDIAHAMACEIMWVNDEEIAYWREEAPEQRFARVRAWVASKIKLDSP